MSGESGQTRRDVLLNFRTTKDYRDTFRGELKRIREDSGLKEQDVTVLLLAEMERALGKVRARAMKQQQQVRRSA